MRMKWFSFHAKQLLFIHCLPPAEKELNGLSHHEGPEGHEVGRVRISKLALPSCSSYPPSKMRRCPGALITSPFPLPEAGEGKKRFVLFASKNPLAHSDGRRLELAPDLIRG
jgi:hypothetical protein